MKKWILFVLCLLATSLYAQVDTVGFNATDKQGRKQGPWKKYQNGKLFYEGSFKDNVPVGTFRYYFPDGKLKSVSEFQQGVHKVKTIIYHPNGKKASEGVFVDQIKDGVWNYYASNGRLITVENYAMGKKTGEWKTFSQEDGTLLEITHYVDDKKSGAHITYYTDGNPCLEEHYVDGLLNGKSTSYLPKKVVSCTGNYLKGKRIGDWDYHDINGKIRTTEEYANGRVQKTYIYIYRHGAPQKLNQDLIAYFIKKEDKTSLVLRNGNVLAQDEDLNDVALWVDFLNFTRVSPRILAANRAIAGYKEVEDSDGAIIVKLRPTPSEEVYAEGLEAQMVKALFNTEKPKE